MMDKSSATTTTDNTIEKETITSKEPATAYQNRSGQTVAAARLGASARRRRPPRRRRTPREPDDAGHPSYGTPKPVVVRICSPTSTLPMSEEPAALLRTPSISMRRPSSPPRRALRVLGRRTPGQSRPDSDEQPRTHPEGAGVLTPDQEHEQARRAGEQHDGAIAKTDRQTQRQPAPPTTTCRHRHPTSHHQPLDTRSPRRRRQTSRAAATNCAAGERNASSP